MFILCNIFLTIYSQYLFSFKRKYNATEKPTLNEKQGVLRIINIGDL